MTTYTVTQVRPPRTLTIQPWTVYILPVPGSKKLTEFALHLDDFDLADSQIRFIDAVQAWLRDCESGRVIGDDELCRRLDARFGRVPNPEGA